VPGLAHKAPILQSRELKGFEIGLEGGARPAGSDLKQ
jgi:hypothetical protein